MIITLLRKPLEGTVAENTLKHGCGGINIDAARIGSGHHLPLGKVTSKKLAGDGGLGAGSGREGERGGFIPRSAEGRWPANFILTHREGCELKGTKKVKSNGHWTQKANIGKFYEGGWGHQEIDEGNRMADEGGKEEVADWDCVEGCPIKALDQQSGVLRARGNIGASKGGGGMFGHGSVSNNFGAGDEGGASRFFKQFKKESKA